MFFHHFCDQISHYSYYKSTCIILHRGLHCLLGDSEMSSPVLLLSNLDVKFLHEPLLDDDVLQRCPIERVFVQAPPDHLLALCVKSNINNKNVIFKVILLCKFPLFYTGLNVMLTSLQVRRKTDMHSSLFILIHEWELSTDQVKQEPACTVAGHPMYYLSVTHSGGQ